MTVERREKDEDDDVRREVCVGDGNMFSEAVTVLIGGCAYRERLGERVDEFLEKNIGTRNHRRHFIYHRFTFCTHLPRNPRLDDAGRVVGSDSGLSVSAISIGATEKRCFLSNQNTLYKLNSHMKYTFHQQVHYAGFAWQLKHAPESVWVSNM